ncbi:uncharacterized protein LOC106468116 isoform X2 [Limulus polyphemus]|uniref:Uncharacterized protein LOC106468116 isoform X2 n=1 Tax=Limulus polyphemus TaxID=6850 RepID=A0ABM1T8C5_LIMPO|nr:uncharacterized protein LOC106468116 isoform X2 [Limulus polyphemus]
MLIWLPKASFVEENLCGADIDNATKISLLQCLIRTSPPWLEDCQLKMMDYGFRPWTERTNYPLNPTRWAGQWPLRRGSRWDHHSKNRNSIRMSGAQRRYRFHDINRPWDWQQKQEILPWQWQDSKEIGPFAPRRLQREHLSSWRRPNGRLMTSNSWMSRHRRFKRHMEWFHRSPFSNHGPRMWERQRWESWSICPFAGFNNFDIYNAWFCIHSTA